MRTRIVATLKPTAKTVRTDRSVKRAVSQVVVENKAMISSDPNEVLRRMIAASERGTV